MIKSHGMLLVITIVAGFTTSALSAGGQVSDPAQFTQENSTRQVSIDWQAGPQMPRATMQSATGIIDGKIYVFGGYPVSTWVHWAYDIASQTWDSTLAHDPYEDMSVNGVVYNNELYVLGGMSCDSAVHMRKYNPVSDTWTILTSPPACTTFYGYGVGVVDDKIYYYYDATSDYTNICLEYTPLTDTWQQKANAPLPGRYCLGSAANGNYCYAVGGAYPNFTEECWRYNVPGDTWEQIEDFPDTIGWNRSCFVRDHLFSPGGGLGSGAYWPARREVYYWHEGTGWNMTDSLPLAVGDPLVEGTSFNNTDYVFVFGGERSGTWLRTMYIGTVTGLAIAEDEREKPAPIEFTVTPSIVSDHGTLQFHLEKDAYVSIMLYDIQGRAVATQADGTFGAGMHSIDFNPRGLALGVYFMELQTGARNETRKILLVR